MRRKTMSLLLLVFVVFSLALTGCRKDFAPAAELPPEDEGAAMVEEALKPEGAESEETQVDATKESVEKTEAPAEATKEAAEEQTEAAPEPTPEPSGAATPEPTPEPTEEATPEPTPEPTEEATSEPTPEPTAVPPESSTTPGTHTVQPGENLFRIALSYNLTTAALAEANGITNPALIHVGQVLQIPSGSAPSTPPVSQPPAGSGERIHIVQPGENLFRIALKYNYDQYYIARYNGIENPALVYVGQAIRIP